MLTDDCCRLHYPATATTIAVLQNKATNLASNATLKCQMKRNLTHARATHSNAVEKRTPHNSRTIDTIITKKSVLFVFSVIAQTFTIAHLSHRLYADSKNFYTQSQKKNENYFNRIGLKIAFYADRKVNHLDF